MCISVFLCRSPRCVAPYWKPPYVDRNIWGWTILFLLRDSSSNNWVRRCTLGRHYAKIHGPRVSAGHSHALRVLKLTVLTVFFLYGENCRSFTTTRHTKDLEIPATFAIFFTSLMIWFHLLFRRRSYGLGADCAHSIRNLITKPCAWLMKIFPSIVNRFRTHVELFNNFLIGDTSSLEDGNLVPLRLVSLNLPSTRKKWRKN